MAANVRKLLLEDKVEVRSLEDGFLGSWHTARVIGCEDFTRIVQYDHLLDDGGSCNLTEQVKVSPAVEGIVDGENGISYDYRGVIRPLPPSCVVGPWSLHYGQCVDLFYEDAWWEGVIFDHEDACEKRRVFFPDMGDEMEARIDMLRLSKDWDEVTEEWRPRQNWMFLELIEEVEQEWPLPVSVKQIWYEVRMKDGFHKLSEWTSSRGCVWRELILQVLVDNFRITVNHLFAELNSSLVEFSEPDFDDVLKNEGVFEGSLSVLPMDSVEILIPDVNDKTSDKVQEQNDEVPISAVVTNERALSVCYPVLPVLSHNPHEDSGIGSSNCNEVRGMSSKLPHLERRISTHSRRLVWQSVVPKLIPGAEFCPEAIDECIEMLSMEKRPSRTIMFNARKHLLHLGWRIEYVQDRGILRIRYFSPNGELFYSLSQVCLKFDHVRSESESRYQIVRSPRYDRKHPVSSSEDALSPSLAGKSQSSSELSKICSPADEVAPVPEYCPEAVREYSLLGEGKKFFRCLTSEGKFKALRAKKHLLAIGWKLYHQTKTTKRELRYSAPNGPTFYSLLTACKWCVASGTLTSTDLSPTLGRMQDMKVINDFNDPLSVNESHLPLVAVEFPENAPLVNESSDMSMSNRLVRSMGGKVYETRISRKRGQDDISHHGEGSLLPKTGRITRGSSRARKNIDADSSTSVRRSSKRVREMVASSSQQTPRTILSWLIDNNVVLPRAKVQYRGRNNLLMAEGRIAREGIKCSCCGKVFSLSKFEVHAGSTNHRPSAHIFLEDGRSLLECQLQLKHEQGNRCLRSESRQMKGRRCNRTNDYICSVCHYGGELVLCDQCPSSFHTCCLGLKEVPDGDWFCPSCCCQICGQVGFDKNEDADSSILICGQCELRYHLECLRNRSIRNLDRCPEGFWFCQDTCEEIFRGLWKMLGIPVRVGTENLTWTLTKYVNHDAPDDDYLTENYSKLNVALSVMHECFEPVKEPSTRRDLVEDVIFNRWSELNRLNFQGFYTVLLEKNDELISAATVRIYGKRVAEIPLVATRFQYRRLGMCRILMNALEKKLMELGVERLVLPAIPSVLNTWTTSFGFSMMNESERLKFLGFTFLDFQGTVICQKILTNSSSGSTENSGTLAKSCDHVSETVDIELGRNDEVFQADQVEEKKEKEMDVVEQQSTW